MLYRVHLVRAETQATFLVQNITKVDPGDIDGMGTWSWEVENAVTVAMLSCSPRTSFPRRTHPYIYN